ncbi:hypothetical protein Tco_1100615 [Tanacetum coccineum]
MMHHILMLIMLIQERTTKEITRRGRVHGIHPRTKRHIKRYCKNPKKKNQNSNRKDESANIVKQVDTTEITAMVSEMNIRMIQEMHMASVTTTHDWWYDSGTTTHVCNNRDLFKTYKETADGHEVMMGDNHSSKVILSKANVFVGKAYACDGMFKLNINKITSSAYLPDCNFISRDHVEIDLRDVRDDTEEYEADASAGDTVEVGIDPMSAPIVEEEIVEPAGEDSSDSSGTRDDIVRLVEDMPVDLDDAVRDFYHHMSEVCVDRIVGIETAQRRLEADQLITSGDRARMDEMIYSLRLENLKVRAMLDIERDGVSSLRLYMSLS